MNIQDKTIELLLEARSHSTTKIGDVENQKYGRDYGDIPDVFVGAQNVYQKFIDDIREEKILPGALGCLGYVLNEQEDAYTLADIKQMWRLGDELYNYLKEKALQQGYTEDDDIDNLPAIEFVKQQDVLDLTQKALDERLEKSNLPVKLTLSFDYWSEGIDLDDIEYTGNDYEVKEYLENIDLSDLLDKMEYEGSIAVDRYSHKRGIEDADPLSGNNGRHYGVRFNNKEKAELVKQADEIKAQLAKTKNYTKSKELQAQLDRINRDIEYREGERARNIQSIKNTMSKK